MRPALTLAIAVAIASVPLAHAASQGGPIIRQTSPGALQILRPGELQNLQSRQQRQNFQLRQQLNREQDSRNIMRSQRLEVPVVKPRCPLQTSGTARTC
jgi:hypothetical protein